MFFSYLLINQQISQYPDLHNDPDVLSFNNALALAKAKIPVLSNKNKDLKYEVKMAIKYINNLCRLVMKNSEEKWKLGRDHQRAFKDLWKMFEILRKKIKNLEKDIPTLVFNDANKDLLVSEIKEKIKELKKEKTELKNQIVARENKLVTQEKKLLGVKSDLNETRSKINQFEVGRKGRRT